MDESGKKGLQASVEGFAHEYIVAGILMKKFQNVSLVDLPLSPYDIIIVFKEEDETEDIIRAQVKTAKKSIVLQAEPEEELIENTNRELRNISNPHQHRI